MLQNLKARRLYCGLTNKEMADRLNISIPYYWMLENGKRKLSYEMAVEISKILDSTPDEIFLNRDLTTS